jgi:phosphoserine phosphatase RsbU/P
VCKDEKNIHQLWWQTVALPLLENRKRSDAVALELRGKTLIDRFRADGAAINALLGEQSARSDAVLRRDLLTTVGLGVVGSMMLLLVGGFAAQASDRAWLEAQRQQQLYENEKQIADKLQQAFLQSQLPEVRGMRLSAISVPAGESSQVGGDWYDAFDIGDGRLLLTVGDVAGHGIEAAVTMVRARQALVATALHEADPAIVLQRVNHTLWAQGAAMVSAVCGFLDTKSLEFTCACAGHPPPIAADADCVTRALPMHGPPLGIAADAHYETLQISMAKASMLVFYTDGAVEQGRDVIAGERRLLEIVSQTARAYRTGDVAARISRDILDGAAPRDDIVLLAISFDRAVV